MPMDTDDVTVNIAVPGPGQTPEDLAADVERVKKLVTKAAAKGATEFTLNQRRWGRFVMLRTKGVGPPKWRLPHAYISLKLRKRFLHLGCGWRYTAYEWHFHLKRSGVNDER